MQKNRLLLESGCISEEAIHRTIIDYIKKHPILKPDYKLFMHFANEGKRSWKYGKFLKDLGMRAGVSDLLIARSNRGFHGAWIEIKSQIGVVSYAQKEFLEDMEKEGYFTAVCWSIEEGIDLIKWYCLGGAWTIYNNEKQYRTSLQLFFSNLAAQQ